MMLLNIRGLLPRTHKNQYKVTFLSDYVDVNNSDVTFIALTETWLKEHRDSEVNIDGYCIYRADRDRKRKRSGRDSGGTALYIKDSCAPDATKILQKSNGVCEILVVHAKLINTVFAVL